MSNSVRFLLYLFCAEILFFSGGLRFIEHVKLIQIIWLLTCMLLYFRLRCESHAWRENLLTECFFVLWIVSSTMLFNAKGDNTFVNYIIYPLGMIFVISFLDFTIFREYLLKIAKWLFFVSIIVHLGFNLGIFSETSYIINDIERHFSFYFFNVKWDEEATLGNSSFTRFNSIYWEPGQCQIVLFYVLVLFSDKISENIFNLKYLIKKFGVLIIGILLTGSTMGYLMFALYFSGIIFMKSHNKKNWVMIVMSFLAFALFFAIFNSSIVQDKITEDETGQNSNSMMIRMADNLACLTVATENPVLGMGINSPGLQERLFSEGDITSSNGWLYTAAQLGFVYLLVLLVKIYCNLKRMNFGVTPIIPLAVLVISQSNEAVTFFPYMWLYVFSFGNYEDLDIDKCILEDNNYNSLNENGEQPV